MRVDKNMMAIPPIDEIRIAIEGLIESSQSDKSSNDENKKCILITRDGAHVTLGVKKQENEHLESASFNTITDLAEKVLKSKDENFDRLDKLEFIEKYKKIYDSYKNEKRGFLEYVYFLFFGGGKRAEEFIKTAEAAYTLPAKPTSLEKEAVEIKTQEAPNGLPTWCVYEDINPPSVRAPSKVIDNNIYQGFENEAGHFIGTITVQDFKARKTEIKEGVFIDDELTGEGKLTVMQDGIQTIYEGCFQNGILNGFGTVTSSRGFIYKGDLKNGVFNGEGKIFDRHSGLLRIEGLFVDGFNGGGGVRYNSDGTKEEVIFVKGEILRKELEDEGVPNTPPPPVPDRAPPPVPPFPPPPVPGKQDEIKGERSVSPLQGNPPAQDLAGG